MELDFITLVILSLATFRLTHLIIKDKIAEKIREPFFEEVEIEGDIYLQPNGFIGNLLSCQWCTGFWVSVILVGLYYFFPMSTLTVASIFAVAGLHSILWSSLYD
jgi:hypothetical protein